MSNAILATINMIDYMTTEEGDRLALVLATTEEGRSIRIETPQREVRGLVSNYEGGKKTIRVQPIGEGKYAIVPPVSFKVDAGVDPKVLSKIKESIAVYKACYAHVKEQMSGMGVTSEDIRTIATTVYIDVTRK